MARIDVLHHAFNVGVVDKKSLHRVDVSRMRLGAERQTNLLADVVGTAQMRPGSEYLGTQRDGANRLIPFSSGSDKSYVLELSEDSVMRVYSPSVGDYVRRVAVSTVILNDQFDTGSDWTLASTAGQTSTISSGTLRLQARAHGGRASAKQTVSVALADRGVEHALKIRIRTGSPSIRVGSASGLDDLIAETTLRQGYHSLAFTPNDANFYIEIFSTSPTREQVSNCEIEAAGIMEIQTPWDADTLPLIRTEQSLDVMWVGSGVAPQTIERRGPTSWSVCYYLPADGPFQAARSGAVQIKASATEGNITLTADGDFFKPTHVDALFRLDHQSRQRIETWVAGENQFTDAFLVSGITETNAEERKWTVTISGTWAGTLRHYRSLDGEFGQYHEYRREQASGTIGITANATYTNDDNEDNIDIWYKMGFGDGDYTSGEARIVFDYPGGSGYGIARVSGYTSGTSVSAEVLRPIKNKVYTADWREGRYSDLRGQPAAVALTDGRLVWGGSDLFDASISDAYDAFDEEFPGDSGAISRSIALGGRNKVRWMLGMSPLVVACDTRVVAAQSSSIGEIITPSNFKFESQAKVGAAALSPVELSDDRAIFVHPSGQMLELVWDGARGGYKVAPYAELTKEILKGTKLALAAQSLPIQRIWIAQTAATSDDFSCVSITDQPEVDTLAAHVAIQTAWTEADDVRTYDKITDVCVLSGDGFDRVYLSVERNVDGAAVNYLERLAIDSDALIGDVCKVMDSFVSGTGAHSATITGLDHLEGRTVYAWVDGAPVTDATITTPGEDNSKAFTVTGGQITLPTAPTLGYCVGLRYEWQYKSGRLAYGVEGYTPMLKNKSLASLGLLLSDYVRSGVKYGVVRGNGFEAPYNLPDIGASGDLAEEVVAGSDEEEHPFATGSPIDLDVRVCIAGASPKPATLRSLILAIETTR